MIALSPQLRELEARLGWHAPGRRPYRETGNRVLAAFDARPTATSGQLGQYLGLNPGYVRKTLARNGRKLARA